MSEEEIVECRCPCHYPTAESCTMHMVPCCETCQKCGKHFKSGFEEHLKSHSSSEKSDGQRAYEAGQSYLEQFGHIATPWVHLKWDTQGKYEAVAKELTSPLLARIAGLEKISNQMRDSILVCSGSCGFGIDLNKIDSVLNRKVGEP